MRSRLLVGAIAWLAALVLFAAAVQWPVHARRLRRVPPATALARSLDRPSAGDRHRSWAVRSATSAQHLLVVDVEAEHARDAMAIAARLVAPIRGRYDEILIYVREAGASDALAARRVQWTPRGGFVELVIR